jgi:hypothetical protein
VFQEEQAYKELIEKMKQEIEEQLAVPFQTGSHQPLSNSDINAIAITAREDGKFSQYTQQYAVEPGHVYALEVMSNDDLSIARDLDKCSWKNNGVRTRQGVKKLITLTKTQQQA